MLLNVFLCNAAATIGMRPKVLSNPTPAHEHQMDGLVRGQESALQHGQVATYSCRYGLGLDHVPALCWPLLPTRLKAAVVTDLKPKSPSSFSASSACSW